MTPREKAEYAAETVALHTPIRDGFTTRGLVSMIMAQVVDPLVHEIKRLEDGYQRSSFSSRACPGCEYKEGVFIKHCELHKEIEDHRHLAEVRNKEIERLKSGKFTPEEFNDLCHETDKPMSAEEFAQGCCQYQKQLFGHSPHEKELAAEQKKSSDLFAKMCSFNLRINAIGDDLTNFLTEEAIRFAGSELDDTSKEIS